MSDNMKLKEYESLESDMFGHHTAEYNIEQMIHNLILLQDHYTGNRCSDCILKHLETIIAYAEEGKSLDHAVQYMEFLNQAVSIMQKHKKLVLDCMKKEGVCVIKSEKDMNRIMNEVRMLRKELNMAVYHMAGDLIYQDEKDVNHDFMKNHDESEESLADVMAYDEHRDSLLE